MPKDGRQRMPFDIRKWLPDTAVSYQGMPLGMPQFAANGSGFSRWVQLLGISQRKTEEGRDQSAHG